MHSHWVLCIGMHNNTKKELWVDVARTRISLISCAIPRRFPYVVYYISPREYYVSLPHARNLVPRLFDSILRSLSWSIPTACVSYEYPHRANLSSSSIYSLWQHENQENLKFVWLLLFETPCICLTRCTPYEQGSSFAFSFLPIRAVHSLYFPSEITKQWVFEKNIDKNLTMSGFSAIQISRHFSISPDCKRKIVINFIKRQKKMKNVRIFCSLPRFRVRSDCLTRNSRHFLTSLNIQCKVYETGSSPSH